MAKKKVTVKEEPKVEASAEPAVVKEPKTSFDERTSAEAPWAAHNREQLKAKPEVQEPAIEGQ